MDCIVQRVTKSQTQLRKFHFHFLSFAFLRFKNLQLAKVCYFQAVFFFGGGVVFSVVSVLFLKHFILYWGVVN